MAEDEIKNSEEGGAKEGKPWLALSLMLLVVPVVTLAITEFVVIPRLQKSMGQESRKAPSSDSEKSSKHRGGHSDASTTLGGAGNAYTFEDMVANLSGAMGTRFIKISFEVRGENADLAQVLRLNRPIVQDAIITALSSESIQSLEVPGGRNRLRLSLIQSINQSLNQEIVEELYFTAFMVQ
jgi:flagellar basal body-associated protein FliL